MTPSTGSLEDVVRATDAEVCALDDEVPYVTGDRRAQSLPSREQARALLDDPNLNPLMRALLNREPGRLPVQRRVGDGDHLPGGVRVIATPGHTTQARCHPGPPPGPRIRAAAGAGGRADHRHGPRRSGQRRRRRATAHPGCQPHVTASAPPGVIRQVTTPRPRTWRGATP
ncbi:hypothetical protein [Deinococcus soli (ex Cha et al. 2016)]|uniref:hypothetical protein n=1 Tax=Deinococcus soli (ex Cha et al. 2016) TaxID=1309411 RepID=UPI000B0C9D3A|nr:hypothetical protein [Deinococcus soli (ex Cha et al. 2016)]